MLRIPHPTLLKWTCQVAGWDRTESLGTSETEEDYCAIRGLQTRQADMHSHLGLEVRVLLNAVLLFFDEE